MNTTSCNICGIVVDKDKLPFIKQEVPPEDWQWQLAQRWRYDKDLGKMVKIAPCPCCKWPIQYETGE